MTSPGFTRRWHAGEHAKTAASHACQRYLRTSHCPPSQGYGAGMRRVAWAALVAILVGWLAAGCASQPHVHLPPKAASSTSASSPATPPSPSATVTPQAAGRQAAIAAYLAIWPAGDRAERSGTPARAKAILAPYTTAAYAQFMVAGMRRYWRHHEVATGAMKDHIEQATVRTGRGGQRAALIVDCQDAHGHALKDARTGHVIAGSRGPRHAKLYASLTWTGGRWQVIHITFAGNTCH
jgi:hypothetical protein